MIARPFAMLLALAVRAQAHGIEAAVVAGGVGVEARYADGSAAAFAEVKLYAPGDERVFQEGLSDREGRFFFKPTTSGIWRVSIDDGMGHALTHDIEVRDPGFVATAPAAPRSRGAELLAGLGFIWGLFGTLAWYRARKRG